MHLETSSNLYGTTVNPFNRALTSGGSSGGEGALLGIRGSCLGVGSDIGNVIYSSWCLVLIFIRWKHSLSSSQQRSLWL